MKKNNAIVGISIKSLYLALGLLFIGTTAYAAGQTMKEWTCCLGPFKGYTFIHVFDPDNRDMCWTRATKRNSLNWVGQKLEYEPVRYFYVGMGLPLGTIVHYWKTTALDAGGPKEDIDSTWTSFYLGEICEGDVL